MQKLELTPMSEPGDEVLARGIGDAVAASNGAAGTWHSDATIKDAEPTFLSKRRAFLEQDIANMRVKKSAAQARIQADRRLVRELTQSVRSNEDALDRLMEAEI